MGELILALKPMTLSTTKQALCFCSRYTAAKYHKIKKYSVLFLAKYIELQRSTLENKACETFLVEYPCTEVLPLHQPQGHRVAHCLGSQQQDLLAATSVTEG